MTSLILHTILALLLLILPFGALYILDRPSIRPLAIALAKGLVQLLIFSLIVWGVYKVDNTWITIVWFLVMTFWAGWMTVNKCKLSVKDYLLPEIVDWIIVRANMLRSLTVMTGWKQMR